ncbi:DUF317 domain-containing protein [Streptomyces sp. NPDC088789]|uniref:DUF317 domain-containing protein n=1 Tax=Streptomyces sp. NPDC088789 TaxID=3365899 RepID=UPI0038028679
MTSPPEAAAPPDHYTGEVYVTPRHLAGTTGTGDAGLRPALDAGWETSDDDLGNFCIAAPDHRIRIGYLPEGDDDALWKIAAYEQHSFAAPRWAAAFSDSCPDEVVAAFTTGLVPLHDTDGNAFLRGGIGYRRDASPVLAPLLDAGWTVDERHWLVEVRSPDALAGAWYDRRTLDPDRELTSNATRWGIWGGKTRGRWYAVFSSHTPTPLITATAAAVADPAPVVRWAGGLSTITRRHATITRVRPPAPTPLELARAHRPSPVLRTVTVPRWSTSTPSARLPGPSRPPARR